MPGDDRGPLRRLRSGSTSQGLLVTLLGDYWFGQTVYIPSAALVALLGEFDISEQAARAALSRVQRSGILEGTRQGRHTAYRLSPVAAEVAIRRGRRILSFTAEKPSTVEPWDQCWTIIAYSLASEQADERRRIRGYLRSLGFAPIQDAVWICPHRRSGRVVAAMQHLGVDGVTVFDSATAVEATGLDVAAMWKLDHVADQYREVIDRLDGWLTRVGPPLPEPTEAFTVRTQAMDAWRYMLRLDPRLPPELLPSDWPGWDARERFASIYDSLGELAVERMRELVGAHSDEAAAALRYDTVTQPR